MHFLREEKGFPAEYNLLRTPNTQQTAMDDITI